MQFQPSYIVLLAAYLLQKRGHICKKTLRGLARVYDFIHMYNIRSKEERLRENLLFVSYGMREANNTHTDFHHKSYKTELQSFKLEYLQKGLI